MYIKQLTCKLTKIIHSVFAIITFNKKMITAIMYALLLFTPHAILAIDPQVKAKMEASTVRIEVVVMLKDGRSGPIGNGSGFVIEGNHVVTNDHVIMEKQKAINAFIKMGMSDVAGLVNNVTMVIALGADNKIEADVVWQSKQKDLAILKPKRNLNKPAVKFVPGKFVHETQNVWVVGFPGVAEFGTIEDDWYKVNFTKGIISKKIIEKSSHRKMYNTDAEINAGNSGGPMFTDCGGVVGINVLSVASQASITYRAIQIDELLPVLEDRGISYATVDRPCIVPGTSKRSDKKWLIIFGAISAFLLLTAYITLKKSADGKIGKNYLSQWYSDKMKKERKPEPQPEPDEMAGGTVCIEKSLFPDKAGLPIIFLKGNSKIVLGRDRECDLVINHKQLFRKHASIQIVSGNIMVSDLGSFNGTYINGRKLSPNQPIIVNSVDRVIFGTEELVYSLQGSRKRATEQAGVVLKSKNSGLPEIKVTGSKQVLGKNKAEIIVKNPKVSSRHLAIWLDGHKVMVEDLDSTNGTYINGKPGKLFPGQPVQLKRGDQLILGTKAVTYRMM